MMTGKRQLHDSSPFLAYLLQRALSVCLGCPGLAFVGRRQAERLVHLQLGDAEAVVDLRHLQVGGQDTGVPVRLARRGRRKTAFQIAESLGLKASKGAIVGAIERGSPAEKSGMKLGDVIVAVDGRPVPDSSATLNAIAAMPPGRSVPVKVLRHNRELQLDVIVGRRKPRPHTED